MAAVRSSAHAVPRVVTASPSEVVSPTGADQGFRSAHRLHKTDEYSSVFAFRRVLRGRWFNLHYCPNTLGHARIGLVVAKKLAKRAVQRNLVKRIGRDLFRHAQADLPAHDLVLRLSAKLDNVTRRMMREDMNSLLGRLPKK